MRKARLGQGLQSTRENLILITSLSPRSTAGVQLKLVFLSGQVTRCLSQATWNWQLIEEHYPTAIWVLDFWHAAQHLSQAAEAIFGTAPGAEKTAWFERWKTTLLDEPNGVAGVTRRLLYYRNQARLSAEARASIATQLNYFRQHASRMQYADYGAAGLPIGSGVTEAGCKELIKARFSRSGMRWRRETGDHILELRAIRLSEQWGSFWHKVMRYAA